MSHLAHTSPTRIEKRYQLQPTRVRLLMLGFALPLFGSVPLILVISLWWLTDIHQIVALVLAGVFLVTGVVLVRQVRRWAADTYLILTSEGLLYHMQTITIQTAWTNIAQIHERGMYPRIELERPAATTMSVWSTRQRRRGIPVDRLIPLAGFGYSAHAPLRQDLQRMLASWLATNKRQ